MNRKPLLGPAALHSADFDCAHDYAFLFVFGFLGPTLMVAIRLLQPTNDGGASLARCVDSDQFTAARRRIGPRHSVRRALDAKRSGSLAIT
jgi:hypothetical protein